MSAKPTDDEILAALQNAVTGRTHYVADRLGMPARVPYVLRRLKQLESAGKVRRSPRYTFVNSIYWVLA